MADIDTQDRSVDRQAMGIIEELDGGL